MRVTEDIIKSFKEYVENKGTGKSAMEIYSEWMSNTLSDVHDADLAIYLISLIPKIRKAQKRNAAALRGCL